MGSLRTTLLRKKSAIIVKKKSAPPTTRPLANPWVAEKSAEDNPEIAQTTAIIATAFLKVGKKNSDE
jgi:hypothetical protein